MDRAKVEKWVEQYFRCWREKDSGALVNLFTAHAVYRSSPFREPHRGTMAIRSYWDQATASQSDFQVQNGIVIIDGRHASVEWWATWTENGASVTLPGCLVLRFDSEDRCEELREYWMADTATREPPEGWGR